MSGTLEFEFRFGKRGKGTSSSRTFRILVLADLAGQQTRSQPLAGRSPIKVDIDRIGKLMASIAPSVQLPPTPGEQGSRSQPLRFTRLEDLHPEAIYLDSAAFAALRKQREALQDPLRFEEAAAALGLATTPGTPAPAAESDADTLNRLFGKLARQAPSGAAAAINQLVRDVVSPHVVSDDRALRQRVLSQFDTRIAGRMRQLLNDPVFRALESAWRGLWQLVSELEGNDDLEISVLDLSRAELEADLLDNNGQGLHAALTESIGEDGPWSLLAADFAFAADGTDLCMLATLAGMARKHDAPLLAAAQPTLVGCTAPEQLIQPAHWQTLPTPLGKAWQALRQRPEAAWLGLVMPRLLGRLPYGKATDPISAFSFEEFDGPRKHEDFSWDNPVYALARLTGEAFADDGWEMDTAGYLEVGPLPSYVFRDENGESKQLPCAEVMLTESAANALLARGIMPMLSYRNRDAARLLRWQSVATPARPLAGVFSS